MADTDRQSSREHGAPAGPIADLRDGPGSDPPTRLLAKMLADARYGRLALRLNRPISRDFPEADTRTRTGDPFITSEVLYQLSYVGTAGARGARRIIVGVRGIR